MGILAVILGLLAVVAAVVGTFIFGNTGLIIAAVLAVAAAVLGLVKRKQSGKGGIAAVVIGVLAVIIALMTNGFWTSTFQELHKKALEFKPDGLWAKVSENATGGVMGLMSNLPQDEASLNQLMEEMNELNKSLEAQQAAN